MEQRRSKCYRAWSLVDASRANFDRYGSTRVRVTVNGQSTSEQLVRPGMAWMYARRVKKAEHLKTAQKRLRGHVVDCALAPRTNAGREAIPQAASKPRWFRLVASASPWSTAGGLPARRSSQVACLVNCPLFWAGPKPGQLANSGNQFPRYRVSYRLWCACPAVDHPVVLLYARGL